MSHNASLNVYFYHAHKDFFIPEIIQMYLANGWNLNDYGHISLRALGDRDRYEWIRLRLDQVEELFEIIRRKVEAKEDPAVVLTWKDDEVGAVTTYFPQEKRINFLLMINRKNHPELPEWTDISWYLPPIIKPLITNGFAITQIEFFEMA
jgi:hypothetical protein